MRHRLLAAASELMRNRRVAFAASEITEMRNQCSGPSWAKHTSTTPRNAQCASPTNQKHPHRDSGQSRPIAGLSIHSRRCGSEERRKCRIGHLGFSIYVWPTEFIYCKFTREPATLRSTTVSQYPGLPNQRHQQRGYYYEFARDAY